MASSAHTFPYQKKRIDFGLIFNPLIHLPVKTQSGWQDLWFLVDSGADTTMIPLNLAKRLGIKFQKTSTRLFGIGAQSLAAFPGQMLCKIGETELEVRCYCVNTEDSVLLLGRLDIFDKFSVLFDNQKQSVIFIAS